MNPDYVRLIRELWPMRNGDGVPAVMARQGIRYYVRLERAQRIDHYGRIAAAQMGTAWLMGLTDSLGDWGPPYLTLGMKWEDSIILPRYEPPS